MFASILSPLQRKVEKEFLKFLLVARTPWEWLTGTSACHIWRQRRARPGMSHRFLYLKTNEYSWVVLIVACLHSRTFYHVTTVGTFCVDGSWTVCRVSLPISCSSVLQLLLCTEPFLQLLTGCS